MGGGRGEGKGGGGNLESPSALQPHSRLRRARKEEEERGGRRKQERAAQREDRGVSKVGEKEKLCSQSVLVRRVEMWFHLFK